ncbi:hypothetical protein ATKI12_6927 [Kitasatospora sp. Ki12]
MALLDLPALQCLWTDPMGRRGILIGKRHVSDPITGAIRYTVVASRALADGRAWAIRCAGPPKVENHYEQTRLGRPPRQPLNRAGPERIAP